MTADPESISKKKETSPGQCGRRTHLRAERVAPRAVHRDRDEIAVKVGSKSTDVSCGVPSVVGKAATFLLLSTKGRPAAVVLRMSSAVAVALLLSTVLGVLLALGTDILRFAHPAFSFAFVVLALRVLALTFSLSCPCLCPLVRASTSMGKHPVAARAWTTSMISPRTIA